MDWKRYRRVRGFFLRVLVQTLWWDIFLNRPVLSMFRTQPLSRWIEIARRFRSLAVEMGGVLIKLGQFLSIRVDILPREITQELAGLQDEVPAESPEDIIAQIEADFGLPVSLIFDSFSPVPVGAASLAQAHRVRLRSGENAVVKVLRPGIHKIVETDLAAIALGFRWLKLWKEVNRRVDADWLAAEFTLITRRELDFENEGRNAERLRQDFAGDCRIHIPKIYWEYCASRTLTLEDVSYIRIGDLKGIEAAGISRAEVADCIYHLYMRQVFETHFVHVDPHPGNLFVRPLPCPMEKEAGIPKFAPGDTVPRCPGRPFQIVFIDFGMMAPIPERLREAIREYAIGLGTRDAAKIVQSYVKAGTLLPGADLKRLEEAHEALFRRLWGVKVSRLKDTALGEASGFLQEYRDVIREAPFQFQADMLFVVRAIGILSGMSANLDPDFDVWSKTIPFARKYAKEAMHKDGEERLRELLMLARSVYGLPGQMADVLNRARNGKLEFRAGLGTDVRKVMGELRHSVDRLGKMVLTGTLGISTALLYALRPDDTAWMVVMLLTVLVFLWAVSGE
ncbi:MAG: ABC1 kinase family protein [Desulfococcaceae bacterium]